MIANTFRLVLVAVLLSSFSSSSVAAPPAQEPPPQPPPESTKPLPPKAELDAWRDRILKVPQPKENACYTATYPDSEWHEVACRTPPNILYPPRQGHLTSATIVGGAGPDFSPTVTGHITTAEGSFDAVTGVTSECAVQCPSQVCPASPSCTGMPANTYSLQLNSRPFTTSTCSSSPAAATCRGWEQWVYEGTGGGFIQYWLLNFGPAGTACPTPRGAACVQGSVFTDGWCPFQFSPTGNVFCVVNAMAASTAPATAVTALGTVSLRGNVAGVGGMANDRVIVTTGATVSPAPGNNYFPDLGNQWQEVEFNVFGNGSGDQAVFNTGSTLRVRTGVVSGTRLGPGCDMQSFTGESNNLTLVNAAPPAVTGSMPALLFDESVPAAGGATATCVDATSVGDTHLMTFSGLYYDFQATGDFVLADRGPDFTVQTRQVSGAPTWPDASVNKAVGVRVGKNTVAVCLPGRLEVNGKTTQVNDGATLNLPEGLLIRHTGNVYLMMNDAGDSVRAQINSGWIDASVGLGRWPTKVSGLLANANSDPNQLETSAGVVLNQPVSFEDLYHRFGESWRVKKGESFLCKEPKVKKGIPSRPFYARDLDREKAERARAVCLKAGVKEGPLLESCILDVTVIGNKTAAKVFATQRAPVVVAPH